MASDVHLCTDIPCDQLPAVGVRARVSINTRFKIRTFVRARVCVMSVACINVGYSQLPKGIC